jgi:hypothetical protein
LSFKNDQAAGVERVTGDTDIHHFGFEVEDMAAIAERLAAAAPRAAWTSSRRSA